MFEKVEMMPKHGTASDGKRIPGHDRPNNGNQRRVS